MSTELVEMREAQATLASAWEAVGRIEVAQDGIDLLDVTKLAREWAKIHGQTAEMREELLRIEVEALVKVAELGGVHLLKAHTSRKAAERLAKMTPDERERLIREGGKAQTAWGLIKTVVDGEVWRSSFAEGRSLVADPVERLDVALWARLDDDRKVHGAFRQHLAGVIEEIHEEGEHYSVAEVAERLAEEIGLESHHPAMREGVKSLVRDALRRALPANVMPGIKVPRVLTVPVDEGFLRVPVERATVEELRAMIAMREEQLEEDRAALDDLKAFGAKMEELSGGYAEARIGPLIGVDAE